MINLNKKVLPKYIYRLNVALVSFFAFWFTACVAVMVTIGIMYGESMITYGTMIAGFTLFFIGLAVFVFVEKKLHKRFVDEVTAELEKDFYDMPYEEAERILKERGIITDTGFILNNDGVFGKEILPFEKAFFTLLFSVEAIRLNIKIELYIENNTLCFTADDLKSEYDMDCALFNFLKDKDTYLKKIDFFNMLVNNKRELAQTIVEPYKIFGIAKIRH